MSWSWNNQTKVWNHSTGAVSRNTRENQPEEPIRKLRVKAEFTDQYWAWLVRGLEGVAEMTVQAAIQVPPPEHIARRIRNVVRELGEIK